MPVTGADPLTFNLVPLITAEGNTYEPDDIVATHSSLPVGSYARVTNTRNGQFVDVRIGGRPQVPVIGRLLELSKGAFEIVAHISEGTFPGLVTPIVRPTPGIGSPVPGQSNVYDQPPPPLLNNYPQTGGYPPTDNYNQRPGGQYGQPQYEPGYNSNNRPYLAQPSNQGYVTPQQQQGYNNYPQSAGGYSYPRDQY